MTEKTAKPKKAAPRKKTTAKKAPAKKAAPKKAPRKTKLNAEPAPESMAPAEQDAFVLSEAAIALDRARQNLADKMGLTEALEKNVEVWTAISSSVSKWTDDSQADTKANLLRLSDFITGSVMKAGAEIAESTLDTIINVNLQISEGLLEGYNKKRIQDRAYFLWLEAGKPDGRDQEFWDKAEKEILKG